MGAIASSLCFCMSAASCACSIASCCCGGSMGPTGIKSSVAKLSYVLLLGVSTILALVLREYGGDISAFGFTCDPDGTDIGDISVFCSGNAAVFRISFVLSLFFAVMFLGTIHAPTCSGPRRWGPLLGEGFHRGWWGIKILVFMAAMVGALFIPEEAFNNDVYATVSRFVSSLFLVLQVIVLIDFAYQWNDDWVDRAFDGSDGEAANKGWMYGVVFFAFLLYAAVITGFVILFMFYMGCPNGKAFTIVTLIAVVLMTVMTLFRDRIVGEDHVGAILPAGVVSFYAVYLVWSAVESSEDASCRVLGQQDGVMIFVGILFAVVSLMWTSFTISKRSANLLKGVKNEEDDDKQENLGNLYRIENDDGQVTTVAAEEAKAAEQGEADKHKERMVDKNPGNTNKSEEETGDRAYVFHFLMITASMYMAMLLTNWGTRVPESVDVQSASVGNVNMWVKIISQWAAILLYIWTLLAPRLLSCREF